MNEAVDSIVCRTTTDFSLRCFFIYYSTLLDFFFLTVWVGIDLIDISINTENKTLYRSIDTLGTDPSSLITTFKTCKTCSSPTCNQKQVQSLVLQKCKGSIHDKLWPLFQNTKTWCSRSVLRTAEKKTCYHVCKNKYGCQFTLLPLTDWLSQTEWLITAAPTAVMVHMLGKYILEISPCCFRSFPDMIMTLKYGFISIIQPLSSQSCLF